MTAKKLQVLLGITLSKSILSLIMTASAPSSVSGTPSASRDGVG